MVGVGAGTRGGWEEGSCEEGKESGGGQTARVSDGSLRLIKGKIDLLGPTIRRAEEAEGKKKGFVEVGCWSLEEREEGPEGRVDRHFDSSFFLPPNSHDRIFLSPNLTLN